MLDTMHAGELGTLGGDGWGAAFENPPQPEWKGCVFMVNHHHPPPPPIQGALHAGELRTLRRGIGMGGGGGNPLDPPPN